jgi:hypothetical protein
MISLHSAWLTFAKGLGMAAASYGIVAGVAVSGGTQLRAAHDASAAVVARACNTWAAMRPMVTGALVREASASAAAREPVSNPGETAAEVKRATRDTLRPSVVDLSPQPVTVVAAAADDTALRPEPSPTVVHEPSAAAQLALKEVTKGDDDETQRVFQAALAKAGGPAANENFQGAIPVALTATVAAPAAVVGDVAVAPSVPAGAESSDLPSNVSDL